MSKGVKVTLIVTGAIVAGAALVLMGIAIGRSLWLAGSPWSAMMGAPGSAFAAPSRWDRMGVSEPEGKFPSPSGYGMMGGPGMMGGAGMMGFAGSGAYGGEPLAIDEARQAVETFLARLGDENLEVGEIMIFDNHAYAQIVEKDTGIGAMEVLVDPLTLAVYPEHGPNMMWNLKYSPMVTGNFGMMGMMGGFLVGDPQGLEPEMPIGAQEAVQLAQAYLDRFLPDAEADEHADPFYGYYTLHILRDGETVGMLSVNGYNGQVFLHTWHGKLLEMSED